MLELSSHVETALQTLEFCYDFQAYEAMIGEKSKQVKQEPCYMTLFLSSDLYCKNCYFVNLSFSNPFQIL